MFGGVIGRQGPILGVFHHPGQPGPDQELAAREIREKYVRSLAGLGWLFIYPICLLMVYLVVFGLIFKMRSVLVGAGENSSYTAYLITGYIPWLGAVETLSRAPQAISANSTLVRQFVFPLEILPLKIVLVSLTPRSSCWDCPWGSSWWSPTAWF